MAIKRIIISCTGCTCNKLNLLKMYINDKRVSKYPMFQLLCVFQSVDFYPLASSVCKNGLGISLFVSSVISVACWTGDTSIGFVLILPFIRHQEVDLIQITFGSPTETQLGWKKR